MNRNPTHTDSKSRTRISGSPSPHFTDGPWEARINTDSAARFTEIVADNWPIAHVYGNEIKEVSANATLIASAPDLLATLKHMVADGNLCIQDEVAAEAAIARAEGK